MFGFWVLYKNRERWRGSSVVGMKADYRLGVRVLVPVEAREFSPLHTDHTSSHVQPANYWALSPGLKQRGSEAEHSFASGTEANDGGAMPLLRHTSSYCGA
jgi:hypothetical protein